MLHQDEKQLMKKIVLACLVALVFLSFRQQNLTVKGLITDESGNPVPGVIIMEKGTSSATSSGADGRYSILVKEEKSVLVFSSVGFATLEEPVKGRLELNVVLKAARLKLDEVVVVTALGSPSAPLERSTRSFDQSLSGKASGLIVTSGYGRRKDRRPAPNLNTEGYDKINEIGFARVKDAPLSTFSIDVDGAAYSNVRRFLNNGSLPPADAVRIEELVNYFKYDYPAPKETEPFGIQAEIAPCPWNKGHSLVMIGLQGKKIPVENLPPSNLVFLIDVSGSMQTENKLPLVQSSMKMLTEQLREEDRISIVVYAGAAGVVVSGAGGTEKGKIIRAIDELKAGGSTAGGEGIQLAYKMARQHFMEKGNNRIILCTDGDFNVGVSSNGELERMVTRERESGVYLTVLGYGMGNYQDSKMQILADKGNGNHAYIDGLAEAKKVLVSEFGGTLFTIANDVKLQVEFNPAKVGGYRLIGYENRMLEAEDFNNDKKDAGEMGSGHTVTALYEIIPAGVKDSFLKDIDPLKYQKPSRAISVATDEWLTVKIRYKNPGGLKSRLYEYPLVKQKVSFDEASTDFRFAAAVAEFGLVLLDSEFRSGASLEHAAKVASLSTGNDREGYRAEFVELVQKAERLKQRDILSYHNQNQ
jgi:Ca-activated chloride channel family protein